nr:hypothetical protein GCM10025699_41650 [Microbacterium flavescens]
MRTICSREAPLAVATRTRSEGTLRSEFSTMRVKNAMPAIDIGTTAAAIPMFVPVTNRVNGTIDAIRMRNGSERPTLITALSTVCTGAFGTRPAGPRLWISAPSGTPTTTTIAITMPTMTNVSPSAGSTRAGISPMGTELS